MEAKYLCFVCLHPIFNGETIIKVKDGREIHRCCRGEYLELMREFHEKELKVMKEMKQ